MTEKKRWVLTDTDKGVWMETLVLEGKDMGLPAAARVRVTKKTLRGGLSDGVDIIEVQNGDLSFSVLPTRGMGIWRGVWQGHSLGWRAPVRGPVHPKFVHPDERGGLGWLAGFDECIVRCGLESNGSPGKDVIPNNMGDPTVMPLNLHGRIANSPAHAVAVEFVPGARPEIAIVGSVDESALFYPQFRLDTRISTVVGSAAFTVADEVVNLKSVESEMELLYHCNFGPPVLGEGARLVVPAFETVPRSTYSAKDVDGWASYKAPTPGYVEQCFWHVPIGDARGNTVALLRNAKGNRGVAVRFNIKQLPCFTQWKNTGAESDGYVTGLEPGTNYPNPRVFERRQGRVIRMAAGGTYKSRLTVEACMDATSIAKVTKEIAQLQGKTARKLHRKALRKYSAGA